MIYSLLKKIEIRNQLYVPLLCSIALFSIWLPKTIAQTETPVQPAGPALNSTNTQGVPSYNTLVAAARQALNQGKLQDALIADLAAIQADSNRFEGYAVEGAIKIRQGDFDQARDLITEAHKRAPADKQAALSDLEKLVNQEQTRNVRQALPLFLTPELQRKFDALKIILGEADRTVEKSARVELLREFVTRSDELTNQLPSNVPFWRLRGFVAIELNEPLQGWQAGRKLIDLKADANGDAKTAELLAKLERNSWLTANPPSLVDSQKALGDQMGKRPDAIKLRGDISGTWTNRATAGGIITVAQTGEVVTFTWLTRKYKGTYKNGTIAATYKHFSLGDLIHYDFEINGTVSADGMIINFEDNDHVGGHAIPRYQYSFERK